MLRYLSGVLFQLLAVVVLRCLNVGELSCLRWSRAGIREGVGARPCWSWRTTGQRLRRMVCHLRWCAGLSRSGVGRCWGVRMGMGMSGRLRVRAAMRLGDGFTAGWCGHFGQSSLINMQSEHITQDVAVRMTGVNGAEPCREMDPAMFLYPASSEVQRARFKLQSSTHASSSK